MPTEQSTESKEPEGIGSFVNTTLPLRAVLLTQQNSSEVATWIGGRSWSRPPMRAVTGIQFDHNGVTYGVPFGFWIGKNYLGNIVTVDPETFASEYAQLGDD